MLPLYYYNKVEIASVFHIHVCRMWKTHRSLHHHPRRGRACPARALSHNHPLTFHIVGRGLDRLTAHNERRQPAKLARSCGCLPRRGKHCSLPDFAPLNRGPTLTTPQCPAPTARQPKSVHQRRHPGASAPQKTSPLTPSPQTPLLPPSRRSPPFPPYRRC